MRPGQVKQNEDVGGARMIGEGCHGSDLAPDLCDSPPVRVCGESSGGPNAPEIVDDQCFITLRHANGSISNIAYLAGVSQPTVSRALRGSRSVSLATRQRIEAIQQSSGQAVHSIGEIGRVIEEINNLNRTIASAVEEQNATARNIASNISNTTQGAQRVATGVSETAIASDEITRNIAGVEQATKQTAEGAAHAETASVKMNDLAGALASLVTQFKVST